MTEYTRHTITEAREGDELLQAGTWHAIASVTPMQHSSNVCVRWAGGGSHSAPAHHFGQVRRAVPIATEVVTTHELVEGDVVHVYGLRVLLGAMEQTRHEIAEGGATFATVGTVINPEYLASNEGRSLFGGLVTRDAEGVAHWTIQGNGLARWAREVAASVTA